MFTSRSRCGFSDVSSHLFLLLLLLGRCAVHLFSFKVATVLAGKLFDRPLLNHSPRTPALLSRVSFSLIPVSFFLLHSFCRLLIPHKAHTDTDTHVSPVRCFTARLFRLFSGSLSPLTPVCRVPSMLYRSRKGVKFIGTLNERTNNKYKLKSVTMIRADTWYK